MVASGGLDGIVQIWDASSGNLKCVLEGPDKGIEVDLLSEFSVNVVFCFHQSLIINYVVFQWVRWHPRGPLVLAGSEDKSVWLWNADKGAYLNTFSGHGESVTCGDFTPDGIKLFYNLGVFFYHFSKIFHFSMHLIPLLFS